MPASENLHNSGSGVNYPIILPARTGTATSSDRDCIGEFIFGTNLWTKDPSTQTMPPGAGDSVAILWNELASPWAASGHSTLGDLSGRRPSVVHNDGPPCPARRRRGGLVVCGSGFPPRPLRALPAVPFLPPVAPLLPS